MTGRSGIVIASDSEAIQELPVRGKLFILVIASDSEAIQRAENAETILDCFTPAEFAMTKTDARTASTWIASLLRSSQ